MRAQRSFSREADEAGAWEGEIPVRGKAVRYYQFRLPCGETELLLTNLRKEEVEDAGLKELYRRRWGIETKYDVVKNKQELENFSGRTVENVKQDYYAMMTPANVALILIGAAEEERERIAGAGGKERKYEYTVNVNHAIGVIKDRFIRVIYTGGKAKRRRLMEEVIERMARRVVPVRRGRHAERDKTLRVARFHQNRKSTA